MKYFKILFLVVLLHALSACSSRQSSKETEKDLLTEDQAGIGMSLPQFRLADLNGDTISSNTLKDNLVVIHVATTWCPYCNAEAPNLENLYKKYKGLGVQVYIIDVKESKELVKEKLQDRFNFTFPVLLDSDGSVTSLFAPDEVLPDLPRDEIMIASNIIIDKSGKVVFMSLLDTKNFDAKLLKLEEKLNELL